MNSKHSQSRLLETYICELQKKYDDLASDPFSNSARLAIRREMEAAKMKQSELQMDDCWKSLSAVFGVEDTSRPGAVDTESVVIDEDKIVAKFLSE